MSEIVIEAGPEAKELFDQFANEHPDQTELSVKKNFDANALVTLIIENATAISASVAVLIGTIKGRGIKFKATKNGVEVDIGGAGEAK
ncbi:hypothetical protein [Rhizobium sullae]|uniref:hypothetical protein n=1 Tax=Rhizobium sullae TaxID=50338 RepID=UPI000B35E57B|nr:hypothetical protein [Rhizobium sullae]